MASYPIVVNISLTSSRVTHTRDEHASALPHPIPPSVAYSNSVSLSVASTFITTKG